MAANLDELVNMQGVIHAFEFTRDGTYTGYKNVTREIAAMICRFCAAVTINFNALASGFTELSEQDWVPQKGWGYVGGSYTVILGRAVIGVCLPNRIKYTSMKYLQPWQIKSYKYTHR